MKIAIIQARTNSSRLPGKVFLPIAGIPLVVLAAQRATNTGIQVIVATSEESSDDALVELLSRFGIRVFRGSLENTLERVANALSSYDDETLVFRLTADNVFPDGALLEEMEQEFLSKGLDYLCCNGEQSGLPYGMSVELMRVKHLREGQRCVTTQYDREHVTPYIRRQYGETYFERYRSLGKGHYRCTIDCLEDYLSLQWVFATLKNPETVPALELVERLGSAPYQPTYSKLAHKLVFGTAQLGIEDYGIANKAGMPKQSEVNHLLKTSIVNGVSWLDTASAYGRSEEVIGHTLNSGWQGRVKVLTKLGLLEECPPDATASIVRAFVDESIYRSLFRLQMNKIDVLMLHRMAHKACWNGAAWRRLIRHREEGRIGALGVSVQCPEELKQALTISDVEFVQMPFNVLDWRWDEFIPAVRQAKSQRKLTVHLRSALLQGLLTSSNPKHWHLANCETFANIRAWLEEMRSFCGAQSVASFCLKYVQSLDWVDGVVVGMETKEQLSENLAIFAEDALSENQLKGITASRPDIPEATLNPAKWKKSHEKRY